MQMSLEEGECSVTKLIDLLDYFSLSGFDKVCFSDITLSGEDEEPEPVKTEKKGSSKKKTSLPKGFGVVV